MSIKKRGASWQVDVVRNGSRVRRQFATAAEAEEFESDTESGDRGRTLGYLYAVVHGSEWATNKTTFMSDMGQRVVEALGHDTKVVDINQERVARFVVSMRASGLSNATINRRLAALSAMLRHAQELGWVRSRPITKMLKEPPGRVRFLSPMEEAELTGAVGAVDRPVGRIVPFLIDTGMRVSEAIGLLWRDINAKGASVHDTKNGDSRCVPLTSRARQIVEELRTPGTAGPFADLTRFRISKAVLQARDMTSMAGDDQIVTHIFRHTCASRLVQRGVPILVVKAWLGHRSLVMVQRYAHLAPDAMLDYVSLLEQPPLRGTGT